MSVLPSSPVLFDFCSLLRNARTHQTAAGNIFLRESINHAHRKNRQEQKNGQKVFHNENSILLFRMRGINVQLQVERFTENEELFYVISKVTLKTGQLIGFSMFNGQLIFTLLCSLHIHALRIGWVF